MTIIDGVQQVLRSANMGWTHGQRAEVPMQGPFKGE